MAGENRRLPRFHFEKAYPARIVSIDGTWQRPCQIANVSDQGAKLRVHGSVEGLNLTEFFLLLSAHGNAHRRCRMVWLKGDEIGVHYVEARPSPGVAATEPRRIDDDERSETWVL